MSTIGNASSSQKKPLVHQLPGLRTSPVITTKKDLNTSSTKTPPVSLNPYNSLPYVLQEKTTPATSKTQNKPAKTSNSATTKEPKIYEMLRNYEKTGRSSF